MIIESNSRGRILIDKFEVKRIAINYIQNNYKEFECIDVKIKNLTMKISLRAIEDYRIGELEEIRCSVINMFKERVHLDIKQLDLVVL